MSNKPQPLYYLASPYTDQEKSVMVWRYEQALKATHVLVRRNEFVISPIVHCHPLFMMGGLSPDFIFWGGFNYALLKACDALIVLTLPCWELSVGVKAELDRAKQLEKEVRYMDWKTFELSDKP